MSEVQQISKKKCGYCGYILPQHFNLLDHSCFQPFNKDTDCINVDENLVVTVLSHIDEFNESYLPNEELNNQQEIDNDELLIYHVSQKRALFDHRIPASDRSTLKKNALWQEICNSLGGTLSVIEVKKRWRYLRDCFLKAKKKEYTYIPSGSAAEALNSKKNSFRFYEQMKFLDDVLGKAPTCTSLPLTLNIQNDDNGENISAKARSSSMLVSPPIGSSVTASSSEESNLNSNRKRKADRSYVDNEKASSATSTYGNSGPSVSICLGFGSLKELVSKHFPISLLRKTPPSLCLPSAPMSTIVKQ